MPDAAVARPQQRQGVPSAVPKVPGVRVSQGTSVAVDVQEEYGNVQQQDDERREQEGHCYRGEEPDEPVEVVDVRYPVQQIQRLHGAHLDAAAVARLSNGDRRRQPPGLLQQQPLT